MHKWRNKLLLLMATVTVVGVIAGVAAQPGFAWTPTGLAISCGQVDATLPQAGTYNWTVTDENNNVLESSSFNFTTVLNMSDGWRALDNDWHTITFHIWYGNEKGSSYTAMVHNCGPVKGEQGAPGTDCTGQAPTTPARTCPGTPGMTGPQGPPGQSVTGKPGKNGHVTVTVKCGKMSKTVHVSGGSKHVTVLCRKPAGHKTKQHPVKKVRNTLAYHPHPRQNR